MDDSAMRSRDLNDQVTAMLRLASATHPKFTDQCLQDPGMLVEDWADAVDITYVSSFDEILHPQNGTRAYQQTGAVIETSTRQTDLSGLFLPAIRGRKRNRIYVQWNGGQPARRNFTLLHEIGHYLQQTDFDLAMRLQAISDKSTDKRFEEDACNLFASEALLPRKYVNHKLNTLLKKSNEEDISYAQIVNKLFDDERRKNTCRVSRPAMIRRIAHGFLAPGYTIALTKVMTKEDTDVDLSLRVYADGRTVYEDDYTPVERWILDRYIALNTSRPYTAPDGELMDIREQDRPINASIASSYSAGKRQFFIVVGYESGTI